MYKRTHHKAQLSEFGLPPLKKSQEIICAKINSGDCKIGGKLQLVFHWRQSIPFIFAQEDLQ